MISCFLVSPINKKVIMAMGFLFSAGLLSDPSALTNGKMRTTTQSAPWGVEVNQTIVAAGTMTNYIDVDTATKYQTIEAFGGCFNELGWKALLSLPAARSDSAIRAIFDTVSGCKFNMCRMPIGASDYGLSWYSLNETANDTLMTKINIDRDKPYLNQFIKAAMKYNPNLKMWASPWSPPTWMKTNGNYPGANSGFKQQATFLKAYALYFEKAIKLYRDDGINLTTLSFQNEPFSASGYPGCLWNMTQCRDFIKNYLGPLFETDQVGAEIWTPTMNNGDVNNFKTMLDDAGSAKYIKAACFQWEGKFAVESIHKSYPNLRIFQTETECGNAVNDWAYAENPTFYYMKFYFDNGANGYFQWNMVLENGGRSTWGWAQNAMISIDTTLKVVRYNPQYYCAKHFSYYVMPGAKKIKTSGNYSNNVAFKNPDGSVVVVLNNTSTSAVSVGIKVGGQMVTAALAAKSFITVVLYNSTGTIPALKNTAGFIDKTVNRIVQKRDCLTFAAQEKSFSAQLVALDGSIQKSVNSKGGASTVSLSTKGLTAGMYILKRAIDGKTFSTLVNIK